MQTSARPKNNPAAAQNKKNALKILGGAYGYFFSHEICPKSFGYVPAGSASNPPRIGPIITPILKHIGNSKNALD
jgi:hypothetical protein